MSQACDDLLKYQEKVDMVEILWFETHNVIITS